MNIEQVREYTLSLFGVTEDQPFVRLSIITQSLSHLWHQVGLWHEILDGHRGMLWQHGNNQFHFAVHFLIA